MEAQTEIKIKHGSALLIFMHKHLVLKNLIWTRTIIQMSNFRLWPKHLHSNWQTQHLSTRYYTKVHFTYQLQSHVLHECSPWTSDLVQERQSIFSCFAWMYEIYICMEQTRSLRLPCIFFKSSYKLLKLQEHFPKAYYILLFPFFTDFCSTRAGKKHLQVYYPCQIFHKVS